MDGSVGPEILGAVLDLLPGEENPGKWLILYDDIRICFIVFQINIKQRLVLFDEGIFQKKGILFRIDDGKFDFGNAFYQLMRFIAAQRFIKIGTDPFADIFCFADIYQLVGGIKILINTREVRQCRSAGI